MSRALKIVRPEPENPEITQSATEPAPTTKLIAPSLGQLSEWKTWPPALAMVDQVIPFMVKTSSEFRELQRIVNCSLRGSSLYIDLSEHTVDSTLVDRFLAQQVLIPTDVQDTCLVNLYGFLQHFLSCSRNRPLTMNRHEYNARILETVQWDFDALDIPVVTLEIPSPKVSPRPDKPHTVSVNPYSLADLTTSQVFEFIFRFWDVILENDDDLMNFFVMNRILELSIARKQIEPLITTADLNSPGDHKRIDHSAGSFMAVSVEQIEWCGDDPVFSVAHYYEQNGDLMRDPEMIFLRQNGDYYPVYFRQDGLPFEERSVFYDSEGVIRYYPRLQKDHARFANTWMRNIKEQQGL